MQRPCWTMHHAAADGRVYPQHQAMSSGYDYRAIDSIHRIPYDRVPDFVPNFNTVVVVRGAKLTDLLSSAPIPNTGFLISRHLRKVFDAFRLPLHKYFDVPISHRDRDIEGFYWLHLPQLPLALSDEMTPAQAEAVIESTPGVAELDLIRITRPSRFAYCFISQPLKTAMEAARITGVRYGISKIFRQTASSHGG
jgi:hypothetical protein